MNKDHTANYLYLVFRNSRYIIRTVREERIEKDHHDFVTRDIKSILFFLFIIIFVMTHRNGHFHIDCHHIHSAMG